MYIYIYIIYIYIYNIYIYIIPPVYNSILPDRRFNEDIKYCPEESVSSRGRKNCSRNMKT